MTIQRALDDAASLFTIIANTASSEGSRRLAKSHHQAVKSLADTNQNLVTAMQWLLNDLHDQGDTHDESGTLYESVENAAAALVAAGGNLSWYTPRKIVHG